MQMYILLYYLANKMMMMMMMMKTRLVTDNMTSDEGI